jgi:HEAT repeat protein
MTMKISPRFKLSSYGMLVLGALASFSLLSGGKATADATQTPGGTQSVYGSIPPDQIEKLSTTDRIKAVASSGSMLAIWQTLEHGERVECLDCIPYVEPLMYDPNPRTREIAAWWLRRRLFGVFNKGPNGEPGVYERTVQTLANDPDPIRRQYAANAVGEFLLGDGVDAVSTSIFKDNEPAVRAAAAAALGRRHEEGKGALSKALGDSDARVKLAALKSAGRINGFSDAPSVIHLTSDGDATVRRNAAQLIGSLQLKDGVDGLMALAKDPDAEVRNAACYSLGVLRDPKARDLLDDVSKNDANGLVRDQALIALRRL